METAHSFSNPALNYLRHNRKKLYSLAKWIASCEWAS